MEENPTKETENIRQETKKSAIAARCLVPFAAAGFILLFGVNFAVIFLCIFLVSAGLLSAAMGALYTLGIIGVASDLAPPALVCVGIFCLFFGLFLGFSEMKLAPFSARLFDRYVHVFRGKSWRRIYYRKKGKNYMALCLATAGVALLGTVGAQLLSVRLLGFKSTVVKDSLTLPAAKYIYISTTGLNFQIKPYDGTEIAVEYTNDSPVLISESNVNHLRLVQDDSFTLSLFSLEQFNYHMTVFLPQNDYREFYLDSGSGDIVLEKTFADYTDIRTRSGNITVNSAKEKISAKAVSGNISCTYSAFENAGTFETKSGNIKILMPNSSEVTLSYRTDGGKLKSDLLGLPEDHYGCVDVEAAENMSNPHFLYITTELGSMELKKSEE